MSRETAGPSWAGTLVSALHSLRHPEAALGAVLAATAADLGADLTASYSVHPDRGTVELLGAGGVGASTPSARAALEAMDEATLARLTTDPAALVVPMPGDAPVPWSGFAWLARSAVSLPTGEILHVLVAADADLDPGTVRGAVAPVAAVAAIVTASRETDRMREELHRLRQERSLAAASLQHDLRTPLTSILGCAATLQRQEANLSPEDRDEFVRVIAQQTERLRGMISEAFDREIASPDAPPRLRRTDMRALAQRVGAAARVARGGDVAVQADEATIVTDPDRVERALLNLADNALKYCPEGHPVHVVGERSGERYTYTVADSGPGVAQDILPSLFAAFATDRTRPGGTGLGLHSVVRLAQELGGKVSYSRQDGVTRFCLTVPDLAAPQGAGEVVVRVVDGSGSGA